MSERRGDNGMGRRRSSGEDGSGSVTPPAVASGDNEGTPSRVPSLTSLEGELLLSAESINHEEATTPDSTSAKLSVFSPVSLSPPPLHTDRSNSDVYVEDSPHHNHLVHSSSNASASGKIGRPPLLPRGAAALPAHHRRTTSADGSLKPQTLKHSRVASSGDQSFMSALTDSDYYGLYGESPRSKKNSNDLLQPILTTPSRETASPQSRGGPRKSLKKQLTLYDLKNVNPLETEAETAIFQAIENRLASEGGGATGVLPNVPDKTIDDMISVSSNHQQPSSPELFHTPSVADTTTHNPSPPKSHRRRVSFDSKRLKRVPVEGANPSRASATVHEKLFNLTKQMSKVQVDAMEKEEEQTAVDLQRSRANTFGGGTAAQPVTAMDNLVQNANILFRRSTVKESNASDDGTDIMTDEEPSPTEKKRFWSFGKRTTHPKKNDTTTCEDMELGLSGERNDQEDDNDNGDHNVRRKRRTWKKLRLASRARRVKNVAVGDVYQMYDFLKPRKTTMFFYCRNVIQWVFIPTLVVSLGLFYGGNPQTCPRDSCPSFSWLFIFLFIRQVITFTLAKVLELFIIDFLSLRNRITVRLLGAKVTLLIVQSKGWPFILLAWSLLDLALLSGTSRFVNHWLYWQDFMPLFNDENPSGNVTSNDVYKNCLIVAILASCAVAGKRLWMGIILSRRTYKHYGKQLASVMNDMLIISLLANLGYELAQRAMGLDSSIVRQEAIFKWNDVRPESEGEMSESADNSPSTSTPAARAPSPPKATEGLRRSGVEDKASRSQREAVSESVAPAGTSRDTLPDDLSSDSSQGFSQLHATVTNTQRTKMTQLLGQWDEPKRPSTDEDRNVSLSSILQFKQALTYMDDDYPFSALYGLARTRELCIQSGQQLYEKLRLKTPDQPDLPFDTIALVAKDKHGEINRTRFKRLCRLFRPDIHGNLTVIDFLRGCDRVYKALRILRASIANSSQIDEAFETIFNVVFYIVLAFILLPFLGIDPFALVVGISSLIVGFAFMIGPASSQYFEGILFILARRPFDVGDRIHVSDPASETSRDGSSGWIVEKVDLYSTTVRFATTNEVATYSNGSLSRLRVINMARSPQAVLYINLKFAIDVEFSVIELFRQSVESFVKARVRQWLALVAFRAVRVEADLGFTEYVLVLQHVSSWQEIGAVLSSKAELSSYCLEVSKKLGIRYQAPPLPVNLELPKQVGADQVDLNGLAGGSAVGGGMEMPSMELSGEDGD